MKNKKAMTILLSAATILVICAVILSLILANRGPKGFSVKQFESLLSDSGYRIVYFDRTDSETAKTFLSILKDEAKKQNIEVLCLDAASASEASDNEILSRCRVPAVIVIDNGSVRIYDELDASDIRDVVMESKRSLIDRPDALTEIPYDDVMKKKSANYDFLLYIGREDCPDCQKFQPIIVEYTGRSDVSGVYYYSIKEARDKSRAADAKQEDIDFYEQLKETFDIQWVPSVYHIINGEIISKFEFLSTQYYELTDDASKAKMAAQYTEAFYAWFDAESKAGQ